MIHQNSSTTIYTEIGTSDTIVGRAYVNLSCPKDFRIDMTLYVKELGLKTCI